MSEIFPQIVDRSKTTNRCLPQKVENGISALMTESDSNSQYAEIGKRLAAVRNAFSDLPQGDWAKKHNIGVTTWNNWERGVRRIPVENAERLCDTYGLDLDFIYRGRRDGLSETASKLL